MVASIRISNEENQSSCAPRSRNTCIAAIATLRLPNPSQSILAAADIFVSFMKIEMPTSASAPIGTLM